jgi:hypothetical protein
MPSGPLPARGEFYRIEAEFFEHRCVFLVVDLVRQLLHASG